MLDKQVTALPDDRTAGLERADVPNPTLCVATRWLGVRSEVWMWRQIRAFTRFDPAVLAWSYENRADYPLDGVPVQLMDTEEEPNFTRRRWRWRLRNLPSFNFYGTQGAELVTIRRYLRQCRPAAVLCHFGHVGLRILPAAERERIPVVVHFHGNDISSARNDRYYRWSLRRCLPRVAAVVCVGSGQRERLIELGALPDRIQVIPCGVPTREFVRGHRDPSRPARFICVARLVEWKGIHHAIQAFARVAPQLPGSQLVIAGDGPELENLQRIAASQGVGDSVIFEGAQPSHRIRELLVESDVFLQHSRTHTSGWAEGFGVSIAEASATGLPVVVSDCGGITEQVIDGVTGFVVQEGDEDAMAVAMLRLAGDPTLRVRMGQAGRQRMVQHFDTDLQVAKLQHVLLSAARREPNPVLQSR